MRWEWSFLSLGGLPSSVGVEKNPNMQPTVRQEVGRVVFFCAGVSANLKWTPSPGVSEFNGYGSLIRTELWLTLGCPRLDLRAHILCPTCFSPSMWSSFCLLHLAKRTKVISMQKEPPELFRGSPIAEREQLFSVDVKSYLEKLHPVLPVWNHMQVRMYKLIYECVCRYSFCLHSMTPELSCCHNTISLIEGCFMCVCTFLY